ncbi:hypothetical protein ACJJTC_010969 [Scirpophaga incertulas]
MISQSLNRVQAIRNKFENLNCEHDQLPVKKTARQLCKQNSDSVYKTGVFVKEPAECVTVKNDQDIVKICPEPNTSYLYSKVDAKLGTDAKKQLTRQTSDPGKKLHRSHAFRCDRNQKINHSPKRHGSCNGRSETSEFPINMGERKLSKERLKRLGNFIEEQMKKECFVLPDSNAVFNFIDSTPSNSIPDKDVPQHILDQYATVVKPKKEEKLDAMTDSGVSSETENLEDEKNNKIKKLMSNFEKTENDCNLTVMNDLCVSSETMRLERKNPHLKLTDTLKKALKQPLPSGPPPKKPPRTAVSPTQEEPSRQRKDTRKMLEKLEQALHKKEALKQNKNLYDIAEADLSDSKSKEMHYLCTELLDITQRTVLPNQNSDSLSGCFNSLKCTALTNSMASLPYTRLSSRPNSALEPLKTSCSCHTNLDSNSKGVSTFLPSTSRDLCADCRSNAEKNNQFKCHLNCKCRESTFFIENEHIYDEPFNDGLARKSQYGTLNSLKTNGDIDNEEVMKTIDKEEKIYDVPCTEPPEATSSPKTDFQKLRENFEHGFSSNRMSRIDENEQSIDFSKDIKKASDIRNSDNDIRKFGTEIPDIINVGRRSDTKPAPLTKPSIYIKNMSKSTENLSEDYKAAKRAVEKKFGTEAKRYRNRIDTGTSTKSTQLDVDRENLNRLMNEIYDTVTAACIMEDRRPGSFPTDLSDSNSTEDSVKLTRSLTEKRKNYVRRVSSKVAYLDQSNIRKITRARHQTSVCSYKSDIVENPYNTFRSWKSFRESHTNLTKDNIMADSTDSKFNLTDSTGNILSMKDEFDDHSVDKLSIDEKTGCVDIDLPFEPRERGLFNVCLLVGLNHMSGEAYVKSVFPSQVNLPPHSLNLIFPENRNAASNGEWTADAATAQCYSFVLTNEIGERSYGYCRRVLPEGASTCLPLCYCLIGKYRAPGFYYKVLQELESHHGGSETEVNAVLQQLFETDFPNPGEEISVSFTNSSLIDSTRSLDVEERGKYKTMPDLRRSNQHNNSDEFGNSQIELGKCSEEFGASTVLPKILDFQNNNTPKRVVLSMECQRTRTIKMPIDPRVDEDNLSTLLDSFGAGLVIKAFGSLLMERTVVILGDNLSVISSCMEALQSALYPFTWQHILVSTIPAEVQREVLEAPVPMLAGGLKSSDVDYSTDVTVENAMLIDLTHSSKVLCYQGDESTILPTSSFKTLRTSLQMESRKHKDRSDDSKTRNLMISEAFLRFFVDILGDFWKHISFGERKDGDFGKGNVVFDKESYIKSIPSKQNQYFLEWFTETAMFNHFIRNMCARYSSTETTVQATTDLMDTPMPNFYQLFDERLVSRHGNTQKSVDKGNYKNAVNKKVKLLKSKLRDLIN